MAKYHRLADQSGFHFVPAVFSHTGQIHKSIKRLIAEQIRNNNKLASLSLSAVVIYISHTTLSCILYIMFVCIYCLHMPSDRWFVCACVRGDEMFTWAIFC